MAHSSLEDNNGNIIYIIELGLTYDSDGIKHILFWDDEDNEYYLDIDAKEIYYSTTSTTMVFSGSQYLNELKAYNKDGTEASEDIKNSIISALGTLLTNTCEVFKYWDLDITMEDFGFTNHN